MAIVVFWAAVMGRQAKSGLSFEPVDADDRHSQCHLCLGCKQKGFQEQHSTHTQGVSKGPVITQHLELPLTRRQKTTAMSSCGSRLCMRRSASVTCGSMHVHNYLYTSAAWP